MADKHITQFSNYPLPKAVDTPYQAPPEGQNPVIRGVVLSVGASLVCSSNFVANFLYNNAGFSQLRTLKELEHVEARYNPTVTPIELNSTTPQSHTTDEGVRAPPKDVPGRFYTIADYHEAFKSGKLTPTAVVEALFPLIRRDVKDRSVHSTAFIDTRVDIVRKAAEASTARYKTGKALGVLDGVPVGIKDQVDVEGYKRTEGSLRDFTTGKTSWAVRKWEEEGAVIIGTLTMHEFGMDTTNNNPNWGTPLNPHNSSYYTGGSSGGSGYVVGSGLAPLALGADGGGSIRIPSNYCGIFGLKPTQSRVSVRPVAELANTTAVFGPMAANMADLEVGYRVMATPDPELPSSAAFAAPRKYTGSRNKVLGIYKEWFDRADPPVKAACQKAVDYMVQRQGYKVIDISIPHLHTGQLAHALTILSEIRAAVSDLTGLTPANKILLSVGGATPTLDFMYAQKLRNVLMQHLASLYRQHPGLVIVTPVTPNAGWPIKGGAADLKCGVSDGNMSIRNMEYVWMANFCGTPCLSFPVGYVEPMMGDGKVPVSLMGMGEWGSEDLLIEWGYDGEEYLNRGLEGGRRKPPNWVDVLDLAKGEESVEVGKGDEGAESVRRR